MHQDSHPYQRRSIPVQQYLMRNQLQALPQIHIATISKPDNIDSIKPSINQSKRASSWFQKQSMVKSVGLHVWRNWKFYKPNRALTQTTTNSPSKTPFWNPSLCRRSNSWTFCRTYEKSTPHPCWTQQHAWHSHSQNWWTQQSNQILLNIFLAWQNHE